ncbi:MAG: flagella basal body P-ring formation protein FlgA [Candidatus Obscuribacterales bacterium]|nr:flagella basal body P-ring formation protein FlgA [Candidatus Obscuribacterales bacterium]
MSMVVCNKDLPAGAVVTGDSVRTIQTDRILPRDSIYDVWIALGRVTQKPLSKGEPVLFHQILPNSILNSTPKNYLRSTRLDRNSQDKLSILTATRNISIGEVIEQKDLSIGEIEVNKCPADALGDTWIAVGRTAIQPIGKGEMIYYHEVIPAEQWQQWLSGKLTSE